MLQGFVALTKTSAVDFGLIDWEADVFKVMHLRVANKIQVCTSKGQDYSPEEGYPGNCRTQNPRIIS